MLPAEVSEDELRKVYTPSAAEIRFICGQFRQAPTRVLILTQLKLLQRLGYMPPVSDVPLAIIDHVCAVLGARPVPITALARYDRSGSKSRHQKILREYARIRPLDASTHDWLTSLAAGAARTKAELSDIVNVLLEELVRNRYELPPLASLLRIASQARSQLNEAIYRAFAQALDEPLRTRLDDLFRTLAGRTKWDGLKREPKRPGPREVTSFLKHIEVMNALADGLPPAPDILSVTKRMQLVTEARALDVHEMRALKPAKRYTLAVLFIFSQLQKALDDVAEIFIKTVRKLESTAKLRLERYRMRHADELQGLVRQFRDVLQILQDDETPAAVRLARMREALNDDPDAVLVQCNEHIARRQPRVAVSARAVSEPAVAAVSMPRHAVAEVELAGRRASQGIQLAQAVPLVAARIPAAGRHRPGAVAARLDPGEMGEVRLPAWPVIRDAASKILRAVRVQPAHARAQLRRRVRRVQRPV